MKLQISLLFIYLSFNAVAQDFNPFSAEVSKRFIDPVTDSSHYFFHSNSDTIIGDSLVFNQYHTLQKISASLDVPECEFWGGPSFGLDTTWLGDQVIYNQKSKELFLVNEQLEALKFNFGIEQNDSSLFYSNTDTKYFIKFTDLKDSSVFGENDRVKYFNILAYDSNDSLINTPTSNRCIMLGEKLGLISFIDCYNFPINLQYLELMGQTNPLMGKYQLTYIDVYPWKEGDIIQYNGSHYDPDLGLLRITYETLKVTSRIETEDSVWIEYESQKDDDITDTSEVEITPALIPLTSPIVFSKNEPLLDMPYNGCRERIGIVEFYEEGNSFFCESTTRLIYEQEWLTYCDSCKCLGDVDGFGHYIDDHYFDAIYGLTYYESLKYGSIQFANHIIIKQIYSKINGVECGDKWNVGINGRKIPTININPNPSNGNFVISSEIRVKQILMTDLSGREVFRIDGESSTINASELISGVYFAYIEFVNGSFGTKQIVIHQ